MKTTDELEALLDARSKADGETWDLYRGMDGSWKLQMRKGRGDDPAARCVSASTIHGALEAALARPRLPVVPRQPQRMSPGDFRVEKRGGNWDLQYRWRFVAVHPTRKSALAMAARLCEQASEAADEWDAKWAPIVAAGVEGVDYYQEGAPAE